MAKFTNAAGKTFDLRGLTPGRPAQIRSGLVADWQEQGKMLPVAPTYTIELPGGATEIHDHNETTIRTDEEKEAWSKYQAALAVFNRELNQRILNAVMLSVEIDPEDMARWEEESKFLGVRIPASPISKRLAYVESEVIAAITDIARLMSTAFVASELATEEEIAPLEAAFRGQLEAIHTSRRAEG